MKCQRLPAHAFGWWTLWLRDGTLWRYTLASTLPAVESAAGDEMLTSGRESLVLPPGEQPIETRAHCHRPINKGTT